VIADAVRNLLRCPAPRRAFACGAAIAALAGCHLVPRAVEGVPFSDPWLVLPLNEWLAEERAEPEAIALCRPPVCGPGLVVAVVRLTGAEADRAEAVLRDPARLAKALGAPRDPRPRFPARASAKRLDAGRARGFTVALARADGSRAAYGAAVGQRSGADLSVAIVIGEDPGSVEETARRVAREHLGSGVVTRGVSL
jgi:hypothetical protein